MKLNLIYLQPNLGRFIKNKIVKHIFNVKSSDPSAGATENSFCIFRPYTRGSSYDQWAAYLSEKPKL